MSFMLDLHVDEHGYKEIFPPYMVNRASMTGTGSCQNLKKMHF